MGPKTGQATRAGPGRRRVISGQQRDQQADQRKARQVEANLALVEPASLPTRCGALLMT